MNNREMLELAAKAAGIRVKLWEGHTGVMCAIDDLHHGRMWMPHHDDGESRRLQLACGLVLVPIPNAMIATHNESGLIWAERNEEHGGDPCAAARIAVLSLAADIGKAMP